MKFDPSLVYSSLSLLVSLSSLWIAYRTLKQNAKMIESSTRPYVSVYGESINTGTPIFYLVVRNFGASPAIMTKFSIIPTLSEAYMAKATRDYLSDISSSVIAPGQSRICAMDFQKIPEKVTIDLAYSFEGHKYSDKFTVNLKAGTSMSTSKNATEGKELRTISYTLQEILQKKL